MLHGLAFSGGKDSWACLWLNEEKLPGMPVIWINTGKTYPETLAEIAKAKALCPNFIEVRTDRDYQNTLHGLPSDLVPIDYTEQGQLVGGKKPVKIQSYLMCCWENISEPLFRTAKELGVTHLIRGQRADEERKAPSYDGYVHEGIVLEHPLEKWTRGDVLAYLETKMEIPDHFRLKHTSLDCHDCTAFLEATAERLSWAEERHPKLARQLRDRVKKLYAAVQPSFDILEGMAYGEPR